MSHRRHHRDEIGTDRLSVIDLNWLGLVRSHEVRVLSSILPKAREWCPQHKVQITLSENERF